MEDRALPFLAVGRLRDQTILATFCEMIRGQAQTEDIFKKLLEASKAKLSPGQRQRLQWGNGSVCCLLDMQGESLYCLITAQMEYPERLAYELLQELNQYVYHNHGAELSTAEQYSLNKTLKPYMEKLIRKYEDPKSFDRISTLLAKTNVVKNVMQDSVRKVVETGESLQELEAKAGKMSEHSRHFATTSREVRRHFWWKNTKMWFAAILVVVIIVVILIFTLRSPSGTSPPPTPVPKAPVEEKTKPKDEDPQPKIYVVHSNDISPAPVRTTETNLRFSKQQSEQDASRVGNHEPEFTQSVFMISPEIERMAQKEMEEQQDQFLKSAREQFLKSEQPNEIQTNDSTKEMTFVA